MNNQDKIEKVIKGLMVCFTRISCKGKGCPYESEYERSRLCQAHLRDDAIALLNEQEPVKPIMHYVPDGKRLSAAWQCGNCLIDIGYGVDYCYNCGRAVRWE